MKPAKSNDIRGDRKAELLGTLAGWLMKIWAKTLKIEVEDKGGATYGENPVYPAVFAMWHSRIFIIPPVWWETGGKFRKTVVLTSASKDGAMLASAMEVFGLGAVRGSSSRRGAAALIGMLRSIRAGQDLCITPDGPRGPRYTVHPGIVKLAQTAQVPIIPIHATFSSAWRLGTWDRLVIPKPFSRVKVVFDEMLVVPPSLDEAAFEAQVQLLTDILLKGADDA